MYIIIKLYMCACRILCMYVCMNECMYVCNAMLCYVNVIYCNVNVK